MAAEWWFYHLEHKPVTDALPPLLLKCLEKDARVLVLSEHEARLEELDSAIWLWQDDSFIPHGRPSAYSERQPVLLSDKADNLNGADMLVLLDGFELPLEQDVQRCMVMFEDADPIAKPKAREQWKALKAAHIPARYFQQEPNGGWAERG